MRSAKEWAETYLDCFNGTHVCAIFVHERKAGGNEIALFLLVVVHLDDARSQLRDCGRVRGQDTHETARRRHNHHVLRVVRSDRVGCARNGGLAYHRGVALNRIVR